MDTKLAPEVKAALLTSWEPVYRSQLHYLVKWSTRGRRPVLKDRHIETLRGLVEQVCEERGYPLIEVAAGEDHLHVLFGLKPSQSVASAVRELRGRTGMALMQKHPELRVWLRGNLAWDERYTVETVSPMRIARVRDRLRGAHSAEPPGPGEMLAAS